MKQQSFSPAISGMGIIPSSRNKSDPDLDITLENEQEKIRDLVRERLYRAIMDNCMVCGKKLRFEGTRGLCEVHLAKVANEGLPRMDFAGTPASKKKKRKAA